MCTQQEIEFIQIKIVKINLNCVRSYFQVVFILYQGPFIHKHIFCKHECKVN